MGGGVSVKEIEEDPSKCWLSVKDIGKTLWEMGEV